MDSNFRAKYDFLAEIISKYNFVGHDAQVAIVADLEENRVVLNLMSHEDNGPWSALAKQAEEILKLAENF